MNLSGQWQGTYTYGRGYPANLYGKSEPFTFDITEKNGAFTGTCMDNVVQAKAGNESYITGTFINNQLAFKKRYKFHLSTDDDGNEVLSHDINFDGVDYTGALFTKFFSRKQYFAGTWSISAECINELNVRQRFVCYGKWTMIKIS